MSMGNKNAAKLIEMTGIQKRYFGNIALDDVDFAVRGGEVHALVGLNGAGKSTLIKVLGGVVLRDGGEIRLNGSLVGIETPAASNALGISVIHQEYSLINELSVSRNIFLGREIMRRGGVFVDTRAMDGEVAKTLTRFGLTIDPRRLIKDLNSGEKQIVEIIRALMSNAWLIVMDEPTSALSEADKERLFEFIRRLRSENIAIIYISHHMPEILAISDRVTVMRDGKVVASSLVSDAVEQDIVREMNGRELRDFRKPEKGAPGEDCAGRAGLGQGGSVQGRQSDPAKW